MTPSTIVKEFFATFVSFFKKKQAFVAILFMLLYRFPEAQLAKLVTPFLVDPREVGGLGLSTAEIGICVWDNRYYWVDIGRNIGRYRRFGGRIEEMDLAYGIGDFLA